ncbi:RNA polymerase sigma factor [Pseudolysobacter antarcticus]|nr:sigma-70 family RNA polymerase sigma factor [Pseudolysobacter antarcticus]
MKLQDLPLTMDTATLQHRFQTLLEQHRKIVFKVANTYCRHGEDRRDVSQEICAQLWKAFPDYDEQRAFSTWMYRIALNVAISFVRSNIQRERHAIELDESIDIAIDDSTRVHETDENVRALQAFIEQQDPLHRALLLLYLEERSYRNIAEILGISETNVATKINRLKQRIREHIA